MIENSSQLFCTTEKTIFDKLIEVVDRRTHFWPKKFNAMNATKLLLKNLIFYFNHVIYRGKRSIRT